jgi:hypothetical protein
MAVLGEGRVVRNPAFKTEPAEPAVRQVQMDLVAKPALGADAKAVADGQHSDHQLGIHGGAAGLAVKWREMPPELTEVHEAVDRSEQMIRRHMANEREVVEQRVFLDLPRSHHRLSPRYPRLSESTILLRFKRRVFQQNRPGAEVSACEPDVAE